MIAMKCVAPGCYNISRDDSYVCTWHHRKRWLGVVGILVLIVLSVALAAYCASAQGPTP